MREVIDGCGDGCQLVEDVAVPLGSGAGVGRPRRGARGGPHRGRGQRRGQGQGVVAWIDGLWRHPAESGTGAGGAGACLTTATAAPCRLWWPLFLVEPRPQQAPGGGASAATRPMTSASPGVCLRPMCGRCPRGEAGRVRTADVDFGLVLLADILDLMALKPATVELVVTGRHAPSELIAAADLVTEMRPLKHYSEAGVPARRGIEF